MIKVRIHQWGNCIKGYYHEYKRTEDGCSIFIVNKQVGIYELTCFCNNNIKLQEVFSGNNNTIYCKSFTEARKKTLELLN